MILFRFSPSDRYSVKPNRLINVNSPEDEIIEGLVQERIMVTKENQDQYPGIPLGTVMDADGKVVRIDSDTPDAIPEDVRQQVSTNLGRTHPGTFTSLIKKWLSQKE